MHACKFSEKGIHNAYIMVMSPDYSGIIGIGLYRFMHRLTKLITETWWVGTYNNSCYNVMCVQSVLFFCGSYQKYNGYNRTREFQVVGHRTSTCDYSWD